MRLTVVSIVILLGLSFFILPVAGGTIFLSPDETATAVSADGFSRLGTFRLVDPNLNEFPWAHPRSFVAMGGALVPVGFLGWPLLMAIVRKIAGIGAMSFVTPLLALSVAFPLWSFFRSRGRAAQISAMVAWLAFPLVILYANRGLFPNLPVVCFAVWAAWFAWQAKQTWQFVAAGLLTGIAVLIRPIEAIWVLPWVVGAWNMEHGTWNVRRCAGFVLPIVTVCAIGAWLAYRTYGSPFSIGYLVHETTATTASTAIGTTSTLFSRLWPFGFHPRNVWWNVRGFLLGYLGPWTAVGLAGVALSIKRKEQWKWLALAAWTTVTLCLIYGQGVYFDNIQGNQITLANSFMRYLLPLAVPIAFAAGFVGSEIVRRWKRRGEWALGVGLLIVVALGWWTAYARDAEGLGADQIELRRYATIQANVAKLFPPTAIVASDRSDKIFFPSTRAISPLPPIADLARLNAARPDSVLVFIRTVSDADVATWASANLQLVPVLNAGNESLYLLQ